MTYNVSSGTLNSTIPRYKSNDNKLLLILQAWQPQKPEW